MNEVIPGLFTEMELFYIFGGVLVGELWTTTDPTKGKKDEYEGLLWLYRVFLFLEGWAVTFYPA